MNPKHLRVWPLDTYPTESMDLANETGDVVVTVSAVDIDGDADKTVLIQDDCVHILVEEEMVCKDTVEKELNALSDAMNITWLYMDSDEKILELLKGRRDIKQ